MRYVITCMPGLTPFLVKELSNLGLDVADAGNNTVELNGNTDAALMVCLWSRVAERVLLPIKAVDGDPFDALEQLMDDFDWQYWGAKGLPIHWAVEHGRGVKGDNRITRQRLINMQPSHLGIHKSPDNALTLRVHLQPKKVSLYVDLSGDTLQRRGYRLAGGSAPIRETLAAAMLWAADWPQQMNTAGALIDPFCGSGTLLIEAAAMALQQAPGLLREHHGFMAWPEVDQALWQGMVAEAEAKQQFPSNGLSIKGFDSDNKAIQAARENAQRAGVVDAIHFERRQLADLRSKDISATQGLLISNPPWGERLEEQEEAGWLFNALGSKMAEFAPQWRALLVANQAEVLDKTGMQPLNSWRVKNGPWQVYLRELQPIARVPEAPLDAMGELAFEIPEEAKPLANRLRKNSRQLRRWLKQSDVQAYRLYDRDLPEFNFAVDVYGTQVLVNEYAPPKTIDEQVVAQRRSWALVAIRSALGVHKEQVHLRTRQQQKGTQQYEKISKAGSLHSVMEGRARVLVNFKDYLDTGLFLDHRPLRLYFSEGVCTGKRFLNLFGYTGVATLQAAVGGARQTTTVDASKKYLQWARNNLAANGFALGAHEMVRDDAQLWLQNNRNMYDVIFCDPPTFSNSSDRQDFVVQRDHEALIHSAMRSLAKDGVLYFSCNFRRFQLVDGLWQTYEVEDITRWSIPQDFSRNQKIHYCFAIRHQREEGTNEQ